MERVEGGHPVPLLMGVGWDRPGGLNRYLRDLHQALGEPACVVLGPATDRPTSVHVAAFEADSLLVRLIAYTRTSARAARATDVVDAHFALLALLPVLGPLRRRPLVVHFQGPWADEAKAQGRQSERALLIKRTIERAVYRRAQRVVVLSRAFGDLVVDRYGVSPERVRVLPPGVDLLRFTPDRVGARSRLGLPVDAQVVFTARRLVPRMGLDVLLSAWSALPSTAQLVIAGEGPSRPSLEAQAHTLGLGGRIRFAGRVTEAELVDHYRAADVSVLPSTSLEGFGLAVLESLACGVPVVVTDVGGLPDAVGGLDPTLVVPSGDPGRLGLRLKQALEGRAPTAEQCRRHAETFDWQRVAEQHRQVYREAQDEVSGGGRPLAPDGANHRASAEHRRLRVVYVDHCAALSGGEIALARLVEGLTDVDAHVILAEPGPLTERLLAAGATVEVLPMAEATRDLGRERVARVPWRAGLSSLGYSVRLARRLRQLQPDLVHTNSLKAALYGSLAGRLAGVPVVWHARDRVSPDYLPGRAVTLVRAAARLLPSFVLANSQATLDTLVPPGRRDRARVVPDPYRPPPAAEVVRHGPLRIGLVGRLAPWKGQDVFLRAVARAFPDGDVEAVLVGSAMFGEQAWAEHLEELVGELGLDGRVVLRGFQDDVEHELSQLDVLVHASVVPEPFGQVIVEGMAAGLPVVAAGAGGPLEVVRHDVDGLLTPPGDVDALASALQRLQADPALRERLGQAARRRAADYLPERVAPLVVAAYREVVQVRRR